MVRKKRYSENGSRQTGCWYYDSVNKIKTYYCSFRSGGKNHTAKVGKSTEAAKAVNNPNSENKNEKWTLAKCALYRAKLIMGEKKTSQQVRAEEKAAEVRDIVHLYKDHYLKDRNGKGRTDSLFKIWVKPYWSGKNIEKATNQDAAKYRVWLEAQTSVKGTPLSPQTIKHAIGLYRRVLRHAKRHIKGFVLLIDDFSVPVVFNE